MGDVADMSFEIKIESDEDTKDGILEKNPLDAEKFTAAEEKVDRTYRENGNSFLQHVPCYKLRSHSYQDNSIIPVCRECRRARETCHREKDINSFSCRFYEFRRLHYEKNGKLIVDGFPNAYLHPKQEDINVWDPDETTIPTGSSMDIEVCRQILLHVGDQFCFLWKQEAEALTLHENPQNIIAWKKAVQGIREICDVCDTTLFNYHWTCDKCGFSVCLDCFRDRKENRNLRTARGERGRDEFGWLLCITENTSKHNLQELMLTQIIPGDALNVLGRKLHALRALWQVPQFCGCTLSKMENNIKNSHPIMVESIQELIDKSLIKPPIEKDIIHRAEVDEEYAETIELCKQFTISKKTNIKKRTEDEEKGNAEEVEDGNEVVLEEPEVKEEVEDGNEEVLEELEVKEEVEDGNEVVLEEDNEEVEGGDNEKVVEEDDENDKEEEKGNSFYDWFQPKIKPPDRIATAFDKFKHINSYKECLRGLRRYIPPLTMMSSQSDTLVKNVLHEWLCDGKLLHLAEPRHPHNHIIFQEVWKCGQPVLISQVNKLLNLDLWHPDAFCRDFGNKPNDLINCLNGNLVPNQPMRHFWEGFQCINKRLLDSNGKPMLLKLKDWPPGDDFAELLPKRYKDLMKGLPLPEYTLRTGNMNLASCLPKMFVPPDLGPKMYNAYGSALHPDKGTTNLHLDISDAVNIMVYVGIPTGTDGEEQIIATENAVNMGGCDFTMRARGLYSGKVPGALWHIFEARDANKIRDLLNRITLERGYRLEPDHDAIHDQNWYLDNKLRRRLNREYGVIGYPIIQCLGDAIFIPAGAPHQVQNLHNCIKVAEDFVSPENISHCYHLTHEFRRLSHSHTNHEDKLQIKNIIFHSIKDACTILERILAKNFKEQLFNSKIPYRIYLTFLYKDKKLHNPVYTKIMKKYLKLRRAAEYTKILKELKRERAATNNYCNTNEPKAKKLKLALKSDVELRCRKNKPLQQKNW